MADDGFDYSELVDGDADDKFCIDLDTVLHVLDEDCDPSESSLEGFSSKHVSPGESSNHDDFQLQSGNSVLCLDYENQGPPSQTCSSSHAVPDSFQQLDCLDGSNEIWYTKRKGTSGCEMPAQSLEPSVPEPHFNNMSVCGDDLNLKPLWEKRNESQLKHVGEDVKSEYASYSPMIENGDVSFAQCRAFDEEMCDGVSGQLENDSCSSYEMPFMDANGGPHNATSTNSTICQGSNALSDSCDYLSSFHGYKGADDRLLASDLSLSSHLPNAFGSKFSSNQELLDNVKGGSVEYVPDATHVSGNMHSSIICDIPFQDNQFMSADGDFSPFFRDNPSYFPCEDQVVCVKGERDGLTAPYQNFLCEGYSEFNGGQEMNQLNSAFPSMGNHILNLFCEDKDADILSNTHHFYQDMIDGTGCKFPRDAANLNRQVLDKSLLNAQASIGTEEQFGYVKNEGEVKWIQHRKFDYEISKAGPELVHGSFLEKYRVEDDDSDVCVIESISHPAPTNQSADHRISHKISQYSTYGDSQPYMSRSRRLKAFDEQNILEVALQDFSQPKSEAIPPDGLMAVPLLRHQRIALSWMVQKETSSLYCSGGILADDQGLGKTVSTIALILKERPATLTACHNEQKSELETLNLDVDDDVLAEDVGVKEDNPSVSPIENKNLLMQPKGRPSAGTLIVCPTSVLRQWAEELQNKVTSKANLSVLVYHGSSRTKDPYILAKYDVVLTTYSIVSMEVPKQPLADKDDEQKGNSEVDGLPPSKKRKCPPSGRSGKKGLDRALLEASAGPLAKVAWFRVVLDEAQSIKNHRTQVSRACWGLRAKRRWCLSGTPIQNAIDDLYSYFRFLRYEPYAVYNTFCSSIKIPINKSPTKGYKKLQAVLRTIMLRRTKGTLLDGEPIIKLPPKYVKLKKVDFSREERDFYSRLEADSRAQFQEYANAGTVKENYVNILLMLLRLRQACDHPLLVKRYNSKTLWRSSVEMAKELPWEKRTSLLKCLEASLALCGICNDSPEDAVVSACGHVFCNQCINEHLTGDDSQCPTTNCKAQLSLVFSRDTLSCSLSDQASNSLVGCSGSEVEACEPCSLSQPSDSSKIKAALEVLNSLCKPQVNASKNISMQINSDEHSECRGNSSNANNVKSSKDFPESQKVSDGSSNDSIVREKAIVFSQWTRMLDLLEACLENSSIQYRRLDGTMSVVARDKAVKDFNTHPEVTVMIMSLKAASLGLNMVAACHVLLLDLWWNPTTEDQAIDRAHRIGQTRPVTVLRLTVNDTVEDRILALQQKKRTMVASAFGEDETGGRQSRLTVDDLKYLFMM